jgi:hypothetical protein
MTRFQNTIFAVAAIFVMATAATAMAQGSWVTCESDHFRYSRCEVDTRGGVRLVDQLSSDAQCVYNRTWGYDRSGIWVNNGCRGRFEVRDAGWHDHSSGSWQGSGGNTVRCESYKSGRNYCRTNTFGGVRLDHQLSSSPCRYHDSWGYDNGGIWVDRGCRADFKIGDTHWAGGGYGSASTGGSITCESENYGRNYCRADTRGGVSLDQQLSSKAQCVFNRSWGYDSGGVWVSNGCRGQFRLGHPGSSQQSASHHSDHDAAKVAAAALVVGAIAAIAADQEKDQGRSTDRDWH